MICIIMTSSRIYGIIKYGKILGSRSAIQKHSHALTLLSGSIYRKYFPKEIFQLPSGLSICKSHFRNVDGSRGVICGPHEVFTEIDRTHHHHTSSFLASQRQHFNFGYQVNPDVKLLGFKDDGDDSTDRSVKVRPSTTIMHLDD
jgi:hypothetical protein